MAFLIAEDLLVSNSLLVSRGLFKAQDLMAGYDTTSQALFNAMTVPPSQGWAGYVDQYIRGLKLDGVWPLLSELCIHCAETAQAGTINAVTPTKIFAQTNAPQFNRLRGFTGDGSSSALTYPDNISTLLAQDDGTLFEYALTEIEDPSVDIGGATSTATSIAPHTAATSAVLHANHTNNAAITTGFTTSIGLTAWSRDNAVTFRPYKNGGALTPVARASTGVATGQLVVLRGSTTFSTRQIAITGVGRGVGFGDDQHLALYNRTLRLLRSVGAQ